MTNQRKKARVYHAAGLDFLFDEQVPGVFRLVAEVETDDLDKAMLLTNDAGCQEWWLDQRVTAFRTPCRSTSVGDLIVRSDGVGYLVMPAGYRRIGSIHALALLAN